MRRVVLGMVLAVMGVAALAAPSAAFAFDCHPHHKRSAYRPPAPYYGYYQPAPRAVYAPPPVAYYPQPAPYRGVYVGGPRFSVGFRY